MKEEDVFWDIGANVGLYSIYAAKFANCKVLAVEPEAQNYATLIENIVLNEVQDYVEAANLPISRRFGAGRLHVHDLTKGGAYNRFQLFSGASPHNEKQLRSGPVTQLQIGVSLDDLVEKFGFPVPSHIKVDVDGNEPEIFTGAVRILQHQRCRSILVEVNKADPEHRHMVNVLKDFGYRCVSERSNWESRKVRLTEHTNMIMEKVSLANRGCAQDHQLEN